MELRKFTSSVSNSPASGKKEGFPKSEKAEYGQLKPLRGQTEGPLGEQPQQKKKTLPANTQDQAHKLLPGPGRGRGIRPP